jgi:ATP-dependent DNA helicase RecQ
LYVNGDECLNSSGQSVLKFSKRLIKKIDEMKLRHYELKSVKVNFILYWLKEGEFEEIKIILPELYFEVCN